MKYKLLTITMLLGITIISCKEEADHTAQIEQMKETIFTKYPAVTAVTINLQDRYKLVFTLGDAQLYTATAAKRQAIATELGALAIQLFGKDNELKKGQLIFTKDGHNSLINPPDGVVSEINIDSLNKVGR